MAFASKSVIICRDTALMVGVSVKHFLVPCYGGLVLSDEIIKALDKIEKQSSETNTDVKELLAFKNRMEPFIENQKVWNEKTEMLWDLKNKGYGILTAITIGAGAIGATTTKAIAALFHTGNS